MVSLSSVILLLKILVPLVYLGVASGYLIAFIKNQHATISVFKIILFISTVLHGLLFFLLYLSRGYFLAATVFEGMFFCSLILSLLYIAVENLIKENSYGVFLIPINVILVIVSLLYLDHGEKLPLAKMSIYFLPHAAISFMAYACFFLSFTISVIYLLQFREIRNRHLGAFFKRLPALVTMDESVKRIDALGLGLLIIGIIFGYLWIGELGAQPPGMSIKIGFTNLIAIIYLMEHVLRLGIGWQGLKACYISIIGFIFVILTLCVGRHGY